MVEGALRTSIRCCGNDNKVSDKKGFEGDSVSGFAGKINLTRTKKRENKAKILNTKFRGEEIVSSIEGWETGQHIGRYNSGHKSPGDTYKGINDTN